LSLLASITVENLTPCINRVIESLKMPKQWKDF